MMFGIVTDVATFFSKNVIDLVTLIRALIFQLSVQTRAWRFFIIISLLIIINSQFRKAMICLDCQ